MKQQKISKSIRAKALVLVVILITEITFPLGAYALTSGPSQPEVQSFEPVGTSEMVDVFSGDFNYNIPLLDVNGYPVNIAYHAGATMDQEASWVGLGWNINPGTINRDMRGLPDDMNGEGVTNEINLKDNWTIGLNAGASAEIFGYDPSEHSNIGLGLNLGVKYNSYKGIGYDYGVSMEKTIKDNGVTTGLNLGFSDDGGMNISPELSMEMKSEDLGQDYTRRNSFNIGAGFNSQAGLQEMNMGMSRTSSQTKQVTYGKKSAKGKRTKIANHSLSFGNNSGITYSMAMSSYSPGISTPMRNESVNLSFRPGGSEFFGLHPSLKIGGFFSNQYIPEKDEVSTKNGYGYLYEQEASQSTNISDRDYLLDFNRINETQLTKIQPYLGWVNHTYDMFSVAAQGVGGTYRFHRNDLPVLHDDFREAKSNGYRAGVELGVGNAVKLGVNIGYNHTGSKSGFWSQGNDLKDRIGFVNKTTKKALTEAPEYEPVFLREVNELVPQKAEYLHLIGDDQAVAPKLAGHDLAPYLVSNGERKSIQYNWDKKNNVSAERTKRNKHMTYRTVGESDLCLDTDIKSVDLNTKTFVNGQVKSSALSRNHGSTNTNHITEISVLNNDGSQHVFGIPAYNYSKIEKSFRVGTPNETDRNNGQITYSTENNKEDNSRNNKKGIDHYYSSKSLPKYTHSFLLTGVLSPDYVDLRGDGISDDDLGSAVKFNYTRVHNNYRWRAPYNSNSAKYSEGLESSSNDNSGSYTYGEKEVWHMHSIEGKTHIAIFTVSEREDGLGVWDENGGPNIDDKSYKLDKIELYSKRELQVLKDEAIPIKTVHFDYSYDLCKGVNNQVNPSTKGKLTLKEIYFTYGKSKRGRFNSYKFDYFHEGNPTYHLAAYDSWGNYAPATNSSSLTTNNAEFPYTNQNNIDADKYASMWNLNKIELPSGGVINVEYEADDYGYVQDKRAMRMFKIKNFGRKSQDGSYFHRAQALYNEAVDKDHNDILFFHLEEPVSDNSEGKAIIRNEYLQNVTQLQTTLYLDINNDKHEFVKTYVEPARVKDANGEWIIDCGVADGGSTGWVRLEKVHIRDNNKGEMVNPIAKAGWQFARLKLNHLINPSSNKKEAGGQGLGVLSSMFGLIQELSSLAAGPNRVLQIRKFCRTFEPNKSWIRLNDPNKRKLGGGHRVKTISMSDEWDDINTSGGKKARYGQEYDYTKKAESPTGSYETMSSGVATFEPSMGRDENPFVKAEFYDQKRLGVPDINYTFEHPIGENFFPGASVGYSRIKVSSLTHNGQNDRHRTGYQVSEFFTYKDFPTKVNATKIEREMFEPPIGLNILSFGASIKKGTAAQGYTIELNDMHGKPSANWSYNEMGKRLSGVTYEYQLDEDGTLDSKVLAIDNQNNVSNETFGVNIDFATDARFSRDNYYSGSLDLNLDIFVPTPLPVPVPVPTLYPGASFSRTVTRTATTTKVIRKTGLLKKTTAYKEGSEIETENLLYDAETGEILLTSVENEFDEKIYSFNYPAHWAYEKGMGQAFQNWGLEVKGIQINDQTGEVDGTNHTLTDLIVPGDVCILYGVGEEKLVWANYSTNDKIVLLGKEGNIITWGGTIPASGIRLRVVKSGRKNMANVSVGSVTSKTNPLKKVGNNYQFNFTNALVLATSAVEYKDEWKTDLGLFAQYDCDTVNSAYYNATIDLINAYIQDTAFLDSYKYSKINPCQNNYIGLSTMSNGGPSEWLALHNLKYQQELTSFYNLNHTFNKSYDWDINIDGDTLGLYSNCSHDVSTFFYDNVGLSFSPKANSIFDYTTTYTELDLSDSTYLYDSIFSKFVGIGDIEILENFQDGVIRTLPNNVEIDTGISNNFIRESNVIVSTSCATTEDIEFVKLGMTDYQIKIKSMCSDEILSNCNVDITTDGKYIKNILSLIDHRPLNETNGILTASVELHTGDIDTVDLQFTSNCGLFTECETICTYASKARRVNPFLTGLRGNWRPNRSWTFVEDRSYDELKANPKEDGSFKSYTPFWQYASTDNEFKPNFTSDDKWVWTSEVTEYSPFGMELENKDPLGRYSSAKYGYAQTLPVAVASNTQHKQLWYEGFEEYTYLSSIASNYICPPWQYPYTMEEGDIYLMDDDGNLDNTSSHSGNISLKLSGNDSLVQEIALNPTFVNDIAAHSYTDKEYITSPADQLTTFRPIAGEYIASAWVKEEGDAYDTTFETTYIILQFEDDLGSVTTDTLRPSGLIIEGWQRIEQKVVVPSGAEILRIKYSSEATTGWFDDFRIFPYNGSMKSYSYDFRTLRLMAEMDENNYATFYEYDLEGNLVRIKKETERGIKTLQESRQNQKSTAQ